MALDTAVTVRINAVQCANCHAWFGIDASFEARARQDGTSFSCPYCKGSLSWHDNENKRLRDQLAREKHWREQAEARVVEQQRIAERIEMRRRGTLGALRKVQKRVKHGVCPCCKRTFQNLGRHMAGKHPTFAPAVD